MDNKKISVKNLIMFSGAFCSFFIGAAFASGQELMQFFTAFGWKGFLALGASLAIFAFAGFQIQAVSKKNGFSEPYSIFDYYLGNVFGKIYTYILVALLYCEFVMMSAGAGATFEQYFGIGNVWGRLIMIVATTLTVLLGLNKIVDILGFIGPLLIAFMALVGIVSIVMSPSSLSEGIETAGNMDMLRGGDTWIESGAKYASYVFLSIVPIWVVLGSKSHGIREARVSSIAEVALFSIACVFMLIAQMKNITIIEGVEIPNLLLATTYVPSISIGFALVILLGIYTTVVFELWYTVNKFTEERTVKYSILTIVLAAIGFFCSGLLPFSQIINYLYSAAYGLGLALLAVIIIHMVARWCGKDLGGKFLQFGRGKEGKE